MPEPTLSQMIKQIQETPGRRITNLPTRSTTLTPEQYLNTVSTVGNFANQQETKPNQERLSTLIQALQQQETGRHNAQVEGISQDRNTIAAANAVTAQQRQRELERRNDYLYKPVPITGIPEDLRGSIPKDFSAPMAWQRNVSASLIRAQNALNAQFETAQERNAMKLWSVNTNLAKGMDGLITSLTRAESAGSKFGDIISAYMMSKPEMKSLVGDTTGQALLTLDQRKEYLKHLKAKRDLFQSQAGWLENSWLKKYFPQGVAENQAIKESIAFGDPNEFIQEPTIPQEQTSSNPDVVDQMYNQLLSGE